MTPSEMIYGKNLYMPYPLFNENWLTQENVQENVMDYLLNFKDRLKHMGYICHGNKT